MSAEPTTPVCSGRGRDTFLEVPTVYIVDHTRYEEPYRDGFLCGNDPSGQTFMIRHSIWRTTPIKVGDLVAYCNDDEVRVDGLDGCRVFEVLRVEQPNTMAVDRRFLTAKVRLYDGDLESAELLHFVYASDYALPYFVATTEAELAKFEEFKRARIVDRLYLQDWKEPLSVLTAMIEAVIEQGALGIELQVVNSELSPWFSTYVELYKRCEVSSAFDRVVELKRSGVCDVFVVFVYM